MIIKRPRFASRRPAKIASITASLVITVGLVILSPFALAVLASYRRSWSQLSSIGQTYGAVSALLSSLALIGVITSLLYQTRDSRAMHEQVTRTFQLELLKMEMEDPVLMTAGGAPWGLSIPPESESIRQFLFIQMWVSFLAGNFVIGETSEPAVRYIAGNELFRSKAGRIYWEAVGQEALEVSRGRRYHFMSILDEEYQKALVANIPISEPIKAIDPQESARILVHQERIQKAAIAATAAIIGLLGGRLWHSNWY